jgi:subfamily B ATP-binding cassette protein MsbA
MSDSRKKAVVRRLWELTLGQRWVLLVACILATIKGLSGLVLAAVSRWLLNSYSEFSTESLTIIYVSIFASLAPLAIIFYYRTYLPVSISSVMIKRMRHQLFQHLQRLSADFYSLHKTGDIVSRMTNDISVAQSLFSTGLINSCFDAFAIVASLGYLILTYPIEISLPLVGICFLYAASVRFFLPKVRGITQLVQEELGKLAGDVSEKVVGMKVLQSFTQEERASEGIGERLESHYVESMKMARVQAVFSTVNQVLPELARILVVVLGIFLVMSSRMSVGDVAGLLLVLAQFLFPLHRSAETTMQIGAGVGALDRVFDFFDAQPAVKEPKDAVGLDKVRGTIEFRSVSFHYPRYEEGFYLDRVSLSIPAGSKVAFVGPSGAGKSTLMDLLSRFYDPIEGAILVDGVDIKNVALKELRSNIGIVMQETIMFSGTIAENIRIGRPDATDDEVVTALKHAYAWEFVEKMNEGINSIVSERGMTLSGGQRQRLAIARIFLKDPRIVVLDEATSALDAESESYVQQALRSLMKDRTTLIIAHRLSTIRDVDHIFVVENGGIVEEGSVTDLLEIGGIFKRLYERQGFLGLEGTPTNLVN